MKSALLAFAALSLAGAVSTADAKAVKVSVTGTWAADETHAPQQTLFSAPNQKFSFSFWLNPTFPTVYQSPDVSVTTAFSHYHFFLGGFEVAGAPDNIAFFSAALGGGLHLGYPAGSPLTAHNVEFYGADIGSQGTVTPGAYTFYPNIDEKPVDGALNAMALNQGEAQMTITSVPEPAAWAVMLVGFGAVGVSLRARRERAAA